MASRKTLLSIIVCLAVVLSVLIGAVAVMQGSGMLSAETTIPTGSQPTTGSTGTTTRPTDPTTLPTDPTTQPTDPTTLPTEPTTQPTEPPIYKLSTATISTTGDFLMNLPCVYTADIVDGEYDFANMFTYFRSYVSAADMAIANLETTLAGADYVNSDGKVGYHGSFRFNSPDGIVPSLQAAGFDLLLTANNHTYDTTTTGFYRTQQILQKYGMDYLGTLDRDDVPLWQIHDVNGIRIGMVCYTYETNDDPEKTALNGIPMNSETASRINTFSYGQLETFYAQLEQQIAAMESAGAEAVMLFIHWGDEYQTKQNKTQSAMAQRICDLGVDVIVGGHPHVLQPVDLLTSTTDENHKTVCIYSLGNAMSNQRISEMALKTGHTEDGALFSVTFAKYSDGTVILEGTNLLPFWVDMHWTAEGKKIYSILPLDDTIEDWKTAFSLTDNRLKLAQDSYNRSMKIVGEGLAEVQAYLQQLVADTEEKLGIAE